jgi:hypothetical protein
MGEERGRATCMLRTERRLGQVDGEGVAVMETERLAGIEQAPLPGPLRGSLLDVTALDDRIQNTVPLCRDCHRSATFGGI